MNGVYKVNSLGMCEIMKISNWNYPQPVVEADLQNTDDCLHTEMCVLGNK